MKILIVISLMLSILNGIENNATQKHLQLQMKKEQKYAQEQKFYTADQYDFKGAEVDEKSLKNIPEQPDYNDDFDMNHVYD